jgi:hypothetical protein
MASFAQTTASFCKSMMITLFFEKRFKFFAGNWQKSQKIVIITLTPGPCQLCSPSMRENS